jgi:putative hydrolase of the HAD superfamily
MDSLRHLGGSGMIGSVTDLLLGVKKVAELGAWVLTRVRLLLAAAALVLFVLLSNRAVEAIRGQRGNLLAKPLRGTDHLPNLLLVLCGLISVVLLSASIYLPARSAWNAKFRVLRAGIGDLEQGPQLLLEEAEVRRRLQDFSTDATELSLIAGDGDFLVSDSAQLQEVLRYGRRCRMVISTDSGLDKPVLKSLIDAGVGVRIHSRNGVGIRDDGQLRGRLKRNANGMTACLFDRFGQGFRVVNLTNELMVNLVSREFERWYERGVNPLIRHVIFDIAGVAFDGDVSSFFAEVNAILPSNSMTRANDYLNLDDDLSLGKTDIVTVIEKRLGRSLEKAESVAVRKSWSQTWTLNREVDQLISSLRTAGYTVSFCSNCDKENAEVYELNGYFENVDEVFLSCHLGVAKPQRPFFDAMLEGLDAEPWECVLLDDMKGNVDAAKVLGMSTVHVPRGAQRKAELMSERLAAIAVHGKSH